MNGRYRKIRPAAVYEHSADHFCSALAKNGPSIGSSLLPFPESREAASTQPRYKVERSFAFVKEEWPGYDHRRTVGHKDGKSSLLDREHGGARTWELSLA